MRYYAENNSSTFEAFKKKAKQTAGGKREKDKGWVRVDKRIVWGE